MPAEPFLTLEQCSYALRHCIEYIAVREAANNPAFDEYRKTAFRGMWYRFVVNALPDEPEIQFLKPQEITPPEMIPIDKFQQIVEARDFGECVDWEYVEKCIQGNLATYE